MDHDQDYPFAAEVSDEEFERAAMSDNPTANFTLGACTGLSECPGVQ